MDMNQQQADPRMVDMVERLTMAAMKIVYDPTISRQLLEVMRQGEPPQSVARAALTVLGQIQEKAQGLPPGAVMMIAPPVVVFLFEIANAAGFFPMDKAMIEQAVALVQKNGVVAQATPEQPAERPEQGVPQGMVGRQMTMGA